MVRSAATPRVSNHEATGSVRCAHDRAAYGDEKVEAVIPGRAKREPGISRFRFDASHRPEYG